MQTLVGHYRPDLSRGAIARHEIHERQAIRVGRISRYGAIVANFGREAKRRTR